MSSIIFRKKLVDIFNKLIEIYCKIYNLIFINFENELFDENDNIKTIYYSNISIYNIHLLWEPLLPILVKKLKICNITNKYKVNSNKSLKEYQNRKIKEIQQRINN
jgi:hypothetical protein